MTTRGRGYTILEVLIFIAVSAFIFFAAMTAVSGRQDRVQFSQSVREFEAKIADTINDVTTGFYPTNNLVECTVNGADGPAIQQSTINVELGANSDCLFVGKAIQFVPAGVSNNESKFYIYSLAGRRYSTGTIPVKSIDEAKPVAVAGAFPDTVELGELRFGVRVTKVFEASNFSKEYGVIGILSTFENSGSLVGTSNSQAVQIGGIESAIIGFNAGKEAAIDLIKKLTQTPGVDGYIDADNSGIVVCLEGSSVQQKASITIGGMGGSATNLQIDDYNRGC